MKGQNPSSFTSLFPEGFCRDDGTGPPSFPYYFSLLPALVKVVPFSRLPKVVSLTEREGMREGTTLTHSDRSVSWFPLSSHSLLEVETVR